MGLEAKLKLALEGLRERAPGLCPERVALAGVSGGRDSVALLDGLVRLGWTQLVVCHLNHGLRGRESGQDAAFVRRLAKRLGLACEMRKVAVAAMAERLKQSQELAGREARIAFFRDMAEKHGTRIVFLGHHLDDQAETMLGNWCRGSALRGLGGMEMASETAGICKIRPLLEVSREEVNAYVRERGLAFREDGSNASAAFRRNRLRHEVLPLLNEVMRRDVALTLTRAGRLAARDADYLDAVADRFVREEGCLGDDGTLRLSGRLKALHAAILSRVLWLWLERIQAAAGIGSREVEAIMAMLGGDGPAKVNLPNGRWLRRRAGRLWVEEARR